MLAYLKLLKKVLHCGKLIEQRAKLKDGTTLRTRSLFGCQMEFKLGPTFPLITTKRMSWDIVVHELLWFISGDTNISYLQNRGINIWNAWADEDGNLGPVYGKQWRNWVGPYGVVDQLDRLITDIQSVKRNPSHHAARRLILTSWNPGDMPHHSVPTGCHTLVQFNVVGRKLSCHLYQRSGDMFLGVPYNIACYSLLTYIIAHMTGLKPDKMVHSFGDAHIYENHISQVKEQLDNTPYDGCKLDITGTIRSIDKIDPKQLVLVGYRHHPALKGDVAI